MRRGPVVLLLALILSALPSAGCGNSAATGEDDQVAVLETNYGRIVIELLPRDAPKHVANFKELATAGFYDGTKFHRILKEDRKRLGIQGGDPNTIGGEPWSWGRGQAGQKTVPAEFSTTLKQDRGVVAAVRGEDPDSATSQFFIWTAPVPEWDGKLSIFGRVIEGLTVVDMIARAPVFPNTEQPLDPVVVKRAFLAKREEVK